MTTRVGLINGIKKEDTMKEQYFKPETELEKYDAVDILTASGDIQDDDNDVPFGS